MAATSASAFLEALLGGGPSFKKRAMSDDYKDVLKGEGLYDNKNPYAQIAMEAPAFGTPQEGVVRATAPDLAFNPVTAYRQALVGFS